MSRYQNVHVSPPCPVCGSLDHKVVITKQVINHPEYDICRRRRCNDCGYRWYTAQPLETICDVRWTLSPQMQLLRNSGQSMPGGGRVKPDVVEVVEA